MRLTTFAATLAVALTLASGAQASTFGSNLIVNGDAEVGQGSSNGSLVSVPGWTTSSNFTAVRYGAAGGFPGAGDAGPADRGLNFFGGGEGTAASGATQTINLSSLSASINTGVSRYDLSAWLGGYASQNDHALLTATFFGSGGEVLSVAGLNSVSAGDRANATGLLLRDKQGFIPTGTVSVGIALNMVRNEGSYNDGYADKLSFAVATPVPEADAYWMMLGGLALLGVVARRKAPV